MSLFGSHSNSSSKEDKGKGKLRTSSIKHAFTSLLGSGNSNNVGGASSGSNNAVASKVHRSSSARRSSVPASSAMPTGFSPMMAFGSPYSLYTPQDYGMAQNELAMTSGDDTDFEDDDRQASSSLLNYSAHENESDMDHEAHLSFLRARMQASRGDDYDADNDGDDERGPLSLLGDEDYDENHLSRRGTRASNALSAAGSHFSGSVRNRKRSAKMFLLNYLGERGFLRPKFTSSKNGVTFHIATSGDTVFLPTISPTDDEYLSHLSRLNDDGTGFDDALERLATRDQSNASRPEFSHAESQSTLSENLAQSSLDRTSNLASGENNQVTNTADQGNLDSTLADGDNVPCSVAIIMSLKKPMELSKVKAELYSRVRVYWSNGVPPDKFNNEEYYTAGYLDWEFTNENFNLYVGLTADHELSIVENSDMNLVTKTKVFKSIDRMESRPYIKRNKSKEIFLRAINDQQERDTFSYLAGDYVFIVPFVFTNNIPETMYLPSARVSYNFRCGLKVMNPEVSNSTDNDSNKTRSIASGFSENDNGSGFAFQTDSNDESSNSATNADNTSTVHFRFGGGKLFKKVKNHLHLPSSSRISKSDSDKIIQSTISLNVIRTPPLRSISTADKPIYINRVWTDSLSYEISFGQKYVPLDAEIPLKIKLVPLVKHLSVKRIRVCVVEKITFVSKTLEYEFEQVEMVANDPYSPYYPEFSSRRKPERILPLLEVRTRDKGGRAMKEEIVENCKSDNLLSYSTIRDGDTNSNVEIVEPLTIDTKIKFPKYKILDKKSSKNVPPYGVDEFNQQDYIKSAGNSRRGSTTSGVIDFFSGRKVRKNSSISNNQDNSNVSTIFRTNSNINVLNHTRLNEPKRGLYASSVNFKHIHVRHKLA